MPVSYLEYYLIVEKSYQASCDQYVSNLRMRVRPRRDFGPDVEVTWLYIGDHDIIHIASPREREASDDTPISFSEQDIAKGGRPIHHSAFRASG